MITSMLEFANKTLLPDQQHEITLLDVLSHANAPHQAMELANMHKDADLKIGALDSIVKFATDPRSGNHSHSLMHGMIGQTLSGHQLHNLLGGNLSLSHAEKSIALFNSTFPEEGAWPESFFTVNKQPGTKRETFSIEETVSLIPLAFSVTPLLATILSPSDVEWKVSNRL